MEMGSGSSSSSNSSDSLNGLKFGQKIYFEDVGAGAPAKSGGGSSSSSAATAAASGGQPPPPPKKGRSGVAQAGQPPRCQVEGCNVDLSDAKTYYSRHKVCNMHSKSPKVTVSGLEQRFCQQCSRMESSAKQSKPQGDSLPIIEVHGGEVQMTQTTRGKVDFALDFISQFGFHQLPEFDQGKRSCRRRLAGHNERRRKPPPGSLLSSRYGRLSSSVFENSRGGGFLMDFSTYPRLNGRDPWPTTRSSDRVSDNQPTATGKFLPHAWQSESENPPSNLFMQGSASGTSYSGFTIPLGECFTGVTASGCALSLLSNQPWSSRDQPLSLGVNNFLNADGTPTIQSAATHGATVNHFPSTSWGFKGNEAGSSLHEMHPDQGLRQMSQPANNQYSGEVELAQQNGRQYMEFEHSGAYDSSTQQHMQWSL